MSDKFYFDPDFKRKIEESEKEDGLKESENDSNFQKNEGNEIQGVILDKNSYKNSDSEIEESEVEIEEVDTNSEKDPKNSGEKPKLIDRIKKWLKKNERKLKIGGLVLGGLTGVGIILVGGFLINEYDKAPSVKAEAMNPIEGSIVYDVSGKEMFRYAGGDEDREVVPLEGISEDMQLAMIALEDENFYENEVGIPWKNLFGAAFKCIFSGGEECRGASGLSQQLIKNVSDNRAPTVNRKLRELMTAIKFNQEVGKDEVLELYLNWVPFGRNKYGIESASQSFYGKSAKDLTIPESCFLASMPQKPTTFSLAVNEIMEGETESENAKELLARKNACIEKMYSKDLRGKGEPRLIKTEKEVEELQKVIPKFLPRGVEEIKFGHIQNYIAKEIESKFEVEQKELMTDGYKIQTSFDSEIQTKIENIIKENADEYILGKGANNGASVVLDGPTGGIVALIGSRDFNNSEIGGQFNVTTAYRQPGSSYKPYVYASAMENGFNPGTVILDAPTDFGNWVPKNFSRTNYGLVTIRYSLQNSLNVPAVKSVFLSQDAKDSPDQINALNNLSNFVSRTGVEHNRECDITSSLGSCEVTMISHTTGFNTLLQEGNLRTANPFVKIVYDEYDVESDRELETILYERDQTANNPYPKQDESIKPEVARETADILSDYGQRDPRIWGRIKSNLELDGWRVAAKTGTTSSVKDAWTVGGSAYYTVSVWVGNTDNKPMNQNATGSTSAAPLWKLIMTELHKDKEPKRFSREGLVAVKINPNTGLPDEAGVNEYMTRGQLSLINQAKERLQRNDYNPLENSIFTNRTPSTYRKLRVDIVDEKLVSEETKLPEVAIKEIECGEIISEFPVSPNWFNPAKALQDTREGSSCPSEVTELTEDDLKPEITSNFEGGSSVPSRIKIEILNKGDNVITNKKLTIKADGEIIYESEDAETINQSEIEIRVSKLDVDGTKDVVITVVNSLDLENSIQYQNVNFDTVIVDDEEITESDISKLDIDCVDATLGEETSCKIDPIEDKVFPSNLTIFIGDNEDGGFCDKNGICANVPTEDNTVGEKDVFISLDGTFENAVKTKYTVKLTE